MFSSSAAQTFEVIKSMKRKHFTTKLLKSISFIILMLETDLYYVE